MKPSEASDLFTACANGECDGQLRHGDLLDAAFALNHAYRDLRVKVEKLETLRSKNHHEVLCLVLRELVRAEPKTPLSLHEAAARYVADIAYPPPGPDYTFPIAMRMDKP